MREDYNLRIETLLNHIKSGKKPIILIKELNISKQLLSYYLSVLKKKGLIKKITNGYWEVSKVLPKDTSKVLPKNIRGHAFIWKIKFKSKIKEWDKREEILKDLQIPYKLTGNTIRIIINNKKVWLTKEGMIIYEPKSFFDSSPISVRKSAIQEVINTINSIKSKLKVNFGRYEFSVKREHYSLTKNELANQVNKEGDKIQLYENGEWWGIIDNSYNLDEFEFFKTKSYSGLVNSTGANGYFNSQKNTGWKVTPEFILNTMNGIQQNQLIFDKNMKSHLRILNKLGKAVENLTSAVKKQNIRENYKQDQKTLDNY